MCEIFSRVFFGRGRSFRQMPNLRADWRHCEPKATQKSGISPPAEPCEVGPDILQTSVIDGQTPITWVGKPGAARDLIGLDIMKTVSGHLPTTGAECKTLD
jgi:hypothetical protein